MTEPPKPNMEKILEMAKFEDETRSVSVGCDIIGGFPSIDTNCVGCGKPLIIENAWMTDGCPCNSGLGVNSMNETRWRLLMELQQQQSRELYALQADLRWAKVERDALEKNNSVLKTRITNAVRGLKHIGDFSHLAGDDPNPLDCSLAGRVSHVFLVGMTSAIELCRESGEDPEFKNEPYSEDE